MRSLSVKTLEKIAKFDSFALILSIIRKGDLVIITKCNSFALILSCILSEQDLGKILLSMILNEIYFVKYSVNLVSFTCRIDKESRVLSS